MVDTLAREARRKTSLRRTATEFHCPYPDTL